MPPPKISPAPTTTPIADEISPAGAASVAIGPVISATLPRQKNDTTNKPTKSIEGFAPVCANSQSDAAAPTKPTTATPLRPNTSDKPGTPNWPKKPPKPSADVTTAI